MRGRAVLQSMVVLFFASCCNSALFAQVNPTATSAPSSEVGVLLMAHGGGKDWNEKVQGVAAEVDKVMPVEVGLGMANRSTLQDGIDKLTARGVKRIVAVPLFVSSHSSVIESTKYLLGLRPDPPNELADFAMDHGNAGQSMAGMNGHAAEDAGTKKAPPQPVKCSVPLQMAPALDRHPIVAGILADRAAAISKDSAHDALILVAHGPNEDQENEQWLADMAALAHLIGEHSSYARIEYLTVRDDADPPVRDRAAAELRKRAQAADDAGFRALIVPLLLSYGGIENGIRQRLDGVEHIFAAQALLPDARIAQWVIESARETRTQP